MEVNIPYNYKPRKYQMSFFKAMDNGISRACLVWHRRSGKSKSLLNFTIKKACERVGIYYHSFPELNQGRKVLWDGIDKDGLKLLDAHIPKEIRKSINKGEMKIELINGSIWQIIGADNYNCFDDKTEILTTEGWKLFSELGGSELVATLDDGKLVYAPINSKVEQDYCGEMVSFKNNSVDLLVTPNHRFYVKSRKGVYKFKTISDKTILNDMIPAACEWDGEDKEFFELPEIPSVNYVCGKGRKVEQIWNLKFKMTDWCAFMGLFLSEGSTYSDNNGNYRVILSHKIEENVLKIKTLLDDMGIKYNYDSKSSNFVIHNKQLYMYCKQFGLCDEKYIPLELKNLSSKYLNILSEWLVMGDGYVSKKGHLFFFSTSKRLIDDYQEISIKLGYSGNVSIREQSAAVIDGWRIINFTKTLYQFSRRITQYKYFKDSEESYLSKQFYKGKVYCVDAGSHVIKVRRNGFELWSGNSLVGPNPVGIVLDEWAVSSRYPQAWDYFRPILAENKGWAVFPYTPRGRNHGWTLFNMARNNPAWFCEILTCDDTHTIGTNEIQAEREAGMPEQMIAQEFFCSFEANLAACFFEGVLTGFRHCQGEYGSIIGEEFNSNPEGLVELWRYPYFLTKGWDNIRYENRYCIGSDISEGLSRDWSVAYVFDRLRREFVAKESTNKINSYLWGDRLFELSKYYENALIVPERNGAGITTIERLIELGANVYFRMIIGAIGKQLTRQYGYLETRESKQLICGGLKSFLNGANGRKPRLFDKILLSECSTFVKDEMRERLGADDGFHDDHVIAAALALHGDFYLPPCEKIIPSESPGWRNQYGKDFKESNVWAT